MVVNEKKKRIVIGLEYDGTKYKGFQKQQNTSFTIQGQVEKALSKIADEKVKTVCSGRTDAGVHAYCQVIHFDTDKARKIQSWINGGNSLLSEDIRILWAKKEKEEFHARFSAVSRSYRYILRLSKLPSALVKNRTLWIKNKLDIDAMKKSSKFLIGEHDFSSFRGSSCQSKTPFRKIQKISFITDKELVLIDITANAFLLNMVRIIIGTLLLVGKKEIPYSDMKNILEAKDRRLAGKTAPSSGLYFLGPSYPRKFNIPVQNNNLSEL